MQGPPWIIGIFRLAPQQREQHGVWQASLSGTLPLDGSITGNPVIGPPKTIPRVSKS